MARIAHGQRCPGSALRSTHQLEQLPALLHQRPGALPDDFRALQELVELPVRARQLRVLWVEDAPFDGLLDPVNRRIEAVLGAEPFGTRA
jgi:hypothetical protein